MVKSYGDEDADINLNVNLLQTIKIPKNLLVLSDRLPQANYAKSESINFNKFLRNIFQIPCFLHRRLNSI